MRGKQPRILEQIKRRTGFTSVRPRSNLAGALGEVRRAAVKLQRWYISMHENCSTRHACTRSGLLGPGALRTLGGCIANVAGHSQHRASPLGPADRSMRRSGGVLALANGGPWISVCRPPAFSQTQAFFIGYMYPSCQSHRVLPLDVLGKRTERPEERARDARATAYARQIL